MSYGFDEKTKDQEGGGKFIQPATTTINGKLVPTTVAFIKSLNFIPADAGKNPYFEVIMENAEGQTVNRRYYEPVLGDILKTQEDVNKAQAKFAKVIANLSRKFLGETYVCPTQPTFEAFCKKVIEEIGVKYSKVPLRTKIILNTEGFPTLPGYAPIWEPTSLPISETKLTYNLAFDVVEAPKKGAALGTSEDKPKVDENIF